MGSTDETIAIILLSACALGLALLVGGAAWWLHANKDGLVKEGRAATTGGESFGATHAQSACIDDALTHVATCGQTGFRCEATTKLRLTSCLSVRAEGRTCNGRLLRGVIEACAAENDGD